MSSDMAAGSRSGTAAAAIREAGIVAVLRAPTSEHFIAISDVLIEAGVTALEVTLTSQGALDCVEQLAARFGTVATIGVGTVVTGAEVEHSSNAGATFVVSPTTSPDVIAAARIADLATYPGALSPSEIQAAARMGATAVKVFPASLMGPGYIKDVHGPFPEIDIMVTGGITLASIPDWFKAGVIAVGMGGPLLGDAGKTGPDAELRKRALASVKAVRQARGTG